MRNSGLTSCAEKCVRRNDDRAGWRLVACWSLSVFLLAGACTTDSAAPPPPAQTQAQQDLDVSSEELGRPLVSDTEQEGTLLGGLLGGAVGFGVGSGRRNDSVELAVPVGMLAGSLAGRYVAAKQAEYSEQVAVIEAITSDVKQKNSEAGRTIKAMEVVVAEHKARLSELRAAKQKGRKNEVQLKQQVAIAERDLATMKQAVDNAEGHLAMFGEARGIIVTEGESNDIAEKPAMKSMDSEIEGLRNRIRSMQQLVGELSSVS